MMPVTTPRMIALLLLATAPVMAQQSEITQPHITVYGTAVSQVTPDTLRWSITVRNKGVDLETVAREHTRIVGDVLTFIKDIEVDTDDIQTADMRFDEDYRWVDRERVRDGYFATTDISFKVLDFRKYRDLWIGLAKKKHVSVDRVTLDVSNRIELQNDTRVKALKAAKRKANAMAAALDGSVGSPIAIVEIQSPLNSWSSSLSNTMVEVGSGPGDGGDQAPLAPGRIAIKVRVKVTFNLH